MELRHLLMLFGVLLIMAVGISSRHYIHQNAEIVAGMTPAEYNEKATLFQRQKTSFDAINSSPESFRGEEVIVKGQVDLALMQEDRYIIYPLLEREKKLYFTECERDEPIGDSAYVKGVLRLMKSRHTLATDSNLTEAERENMETARETMKEYNYSVPDYMDNQTEYVWAIECTELLPVY